MDISSLVQSTGLGAAKNALGIFGAAVEDFARGGVQRGTVVSQPQRPQSEELTKNNTQYSSASYAAALAGGTNWRPKLKFLFKVEFFFTQEAKTMLSAITGATMNELDNNEFTFMVKTVDRPKIDFEYEDDVNMYNFRTKVLKKIRHRELTMTFMDDTGNRVINFFDHMMLLHSPITRRAINRVNAYGKPDPYSIDEPGSGMVFSSGDGSDGNDLSHRAVINSPVGNAIESIRVKQMFTDLSAVSGENLKQVCFDFVNPRIVSFDLDDLSHEASEVNLLTMQFDYDWLEIMDNTITDQAQNTPVFKGIAPGVNETPFDVSPAKGGVQTSPGGADSYSRLKDNPGLPPEPSQVNRALDMTPGGKAASVLNGIIKNRGAQLLRTAVNQAGIRPIRLPIFDSVLGSPQQATVVRSSNSYL